MLDDDTRSELNAAFIDRLIQRWETLLEHHIAMRHQTEEPDPDEAEAIEQRLREDLGRVDKQITALRERMQEEGGTLPLDRLADACGLDPIERSILQLALAPHLDLSFRERIARFHNNILFDFVDVDLVLTLLFPGRTGRLQARRYFGWDAPLMAHGLLRLESPRDAKGSGLMAQELRPPERLADFVLGRRTLDRSLWFCAELEIPQVPLDHVVLPRDDVEGLLSVVGHLAADVPRRPDEVVPPFSMEPGATVEIAGPPGTGKTLLARAVAHELGRPLIHVDGAALAAAAGYRDVLASLFTEARVQGAVLVVDRATQLLSADQPRLPAVLAELDRFGGPTILVHEGRDDLDQSAERYVSWKVDVGLPAPDHRSAIWSAHQPSDVEVADDVDYQDLSTRFDLSGAQIANAWAVARRHALTAADGQRSPVVDDVTLRRAAGAQIRANTEDYAVRSRVGLTMKDLVLPEEPRVLIDELLEACRNRVFVMSKWGFGRRLSTGRGIAALFKGEPGTGKTLCAEILASELGMSLYQISIPRIVSKYIGETEKNISRIFSTARANHSMLLFDEADSLFGKRVQVEKAVDRYSNMETNLLMQEIERFDGITLMTTNLDKNIDDAFGRRIQFTVDFPFPDESHRAQIWRTLVPKECPIADDVDFDELGENFELSGGHIKNAIVRAAYRAASREDAVRYRDIEFAAEQECKSAGKLFRTSSAEDVL